MAITDVAVFSSSPEPGTVDPGGRGQPAATLIGSTSIFLWAVWPALAVYSSPAPTFQILATGMTIGFLALAALRIGRGEPLSGMLPKSWGLLLAGVVGILGTNTFNFIAVTRISPAQASVIAYLWPIIALVLAGALGLKRLQSKHYVAVVLGFVGAVFVINPFTGMELDFIGILCAFLAGLSFAAYTTYRLVDSRSASDAVGIYGLISAIICAALHFGIETTQSLNATQIAAVVVLGLAPMGLANAVWDYGVARGDARALSVLAYGTPLVATFLLVFLGLADITPTLIIGALLIVGAAAIGTWPARSEP
ncbi:DMT family transporter [uncultured Tateyamaria sp.]|uniref:DMT family transporter n=1 Tax=uncultured Tateyamaria sp. TaxID=455651 RepID=UPI002619E205|nr:DMT family transporter [uncultured Tateyamaria sp.]